MNDLISRKALIAEYDRVHIGPPGGARKLMEDAPAVDAVPVVRCKDCKCGKHPESTLMAGKYVNCALYDPMPMMRCNDFCSYGERKDNG